MHGPEIGQGPVFYPPPRPLGELFLFVLSGYQAENVRRRGV